MIRPIRIKARIVRLSIRQTCDVADLQVSDRNVSPWKCPAIGAGRLIDRISAICYRIRTLTGAWYGGQHASEEKAEGDSTRTQSHRRDGRPVEKTQFTKRSDQVSAQIPEPCSGRSVANGYDDQMTRAAVRSHFPADGANSPPCAISRDGLAKPLAHGDDNAIFRGIACTDMQPATPEQRSGPPEIVNLAPQSGARPHRFRARSVRGPCAGAWRISDARPGFACGGESRACFFVSGCWAGTSASLPLSVRCAENSRCCI